MLSSKDDDFYPKKAILVFKNGPYPKTYSEKLQPKLHHML